jgi:colicin import membrane protein
MSTKSGLHGKPSSARQAAHVNPHRGRTGDTDRMALTDTSRRVCPGNSVRSDVSGCTRFPRQPPRERGTGCAFGLSVAIHAVLAALVFSSLYEAHDAATASNTVVTGRLASLPIASPLPPLAVHPSALPVTTRGARLATRPEPASVVRHRDNGMKLQRPRVAVELAAKAASHSSLHLAVQQPSESPAGGLVEQERATRLAALLNLAGRMPPNDGLSRTEIGATVSLGYADKVAQRVRANVRAPFAIEGDPSTVIAVTCTPTGALLSATVRSSSGNPQWDRAVLSAVEQSDPMPSDVDGSTPTSFLIRFQPKG